MYHKRFSSSSLAITGVGALVLKEDVWLSTEEKGDWTWMEHFHSFGLDFNTVLDLLQLI